MKRILLTTLLLGALLLSGCSEKTLTINDVWARPGTAGGNGAVYFVINNPANTADDVLNASSDIAAAVKLHMSMMNSDGTMMMQQQESVPVAAGSQVEFKPGGLHVMLINLNQSLKVGDKFQVKLSLQNAGDITLDVTVREP